MYRPKYREITLTCFLPGDRKIIQIISDPLGISQEEMWDYYEKACIAFMFMVSVKSIPLLEPT